MVAVFKLNGGPLYIDPAFEIARTGYWNGNKPAWTRGILGRRTVFSNTTSLHDLCPFLTAAELVFATLAGTEALEIVSSSASDDMGGIGAEKVKVTYIKASDGTQATIQVNLDGLTPVALGISALMVQWAEVSQVGSNEVAVGNISIRNVAVPATVYEQIQAGGNRSLSGRVMIPAACTGYIKSWHASAVNQNQDIRLRAQRFADGTLAPTYLFQDEVFLGLDSSLQSDLLYVSVPAGGIVKTSSITSNAGGNPRAQASFDLIVIGD